MKVVLSKVANGQIPNCHVVVGSRRVIERPSLLC